MNLIPAFIHQRNFLDSTFRVFSSGLFAIGCFESSEGHSPTSALLKILNYLGAPTQWITSTASWLSDRWELLVIAAVICVAIGTLSTNEAHASRTASTQLIGLALLLEVLPSPWIVAGLIPLTGTRMWLARHSHVRNPTIVLNECFLAVGAVIWVPWAWLTGAPPRPDNATAQSQATE